MKKTLCILIFAVFVSCNNRQEVNNMTIIDDCDVENNGIQYINNGLSKIMIEIINEMIAFYDSVDTGWYNILDIYLSKKKNDCYIAISAGQCYDPWLKYYIIMDDKLIAIYKIADECNYDFFDTTKLNKFYGTPLELILDTTMNHSVRIKKLEELEKNMTKIEGFPDEPPFASYHPIGRQYKIHSKDSLELVYTGRFY